MKTTQTLTSQNKPDYSGAAFGFAEQAYSEGFLSPENYFLASAAGRRSSMESSMGAIQDSGYLEHRVKRACPKI